MQLLVQLLKDELLQSIRFQLSNVGPQSDVGKLYKKGGS